MALWGLSDMDIPEPEYLRSLRDQYHALAETDPYVHGFGPKTVEFLLVEAAVFGESGLTGIKIPEQLVFKMRSKYKLIYKGEGFYDVEW